MKIRVNDLKSKGNLMALSYCRNSNKENVDGTIIIDKYISGTVDVKN